MNHNKPSVRRFLERMKGRERPGASTALALLVFLAAVFLGGVVGQLVAPYIPFHTVNISIGNYTTNPVGFLIGGLVAFPAFVYLARGTKTESVIRG